MLAWLNGPFGVGKTQTAHELHRRLPGSLVSDPERLGAGLHRMLPRALRSDFQDLAAWRAGTVEVLDLLLRRHRGVVLVPMTLVEPAYADEVLGGLGQRGHDVRHVALLAQRETVQRRLQRRSGGPLLARLRPDTWALDRLDGCLAGLQARDDVERVDTDGRTVAQVADAVAGRLGLVLGPPSRVPLVARVVTATRHVRLP